MSTKSVQFNEEKNETLEFEHPPDTRYEDLWFTSDDYVVIKAKSREEARMWRRSGYGVLLMDVFYMPVSGTQEFLNAFTQMEGELAARGLERHLCRKHGEERSEIKDRARQAVISHQRRMKRNEIEPDSMAEKLADIYRETVRPAKVFAIKIGKADEYVMACGEDSRPAELLAEAAVGGGNRRMERRLSNFSTKSGSSFDSKRTWGPRGQKSRSRCPASPASPVDEYYAAIA